MKSFWALLFVLLYLLAMLRPVMPLLEYVVHQDYIAEFLCINKEKPELACEGKCYLMQKLNEQHEEKRQNLPPIVMEEYPIGFVAILNLNRSKDNAPRTANNFTYQANYTYLFVRNDLDPPNSAA